MAFYTIYTPSGIPEESYRRVASVDPLVADRKEPPEMLRLARFTDIAEWDVTAEYLRIARAFYEAEQHHADELRRAEGEPAFEQRQVGNRARLAAIEAGLIRRSLFVARRPG
ncbi:MAG: hypothetical protein HYS09_02150 [Chloroflexi bacterium]|nr:hypothetical protein [Chloroflexota bacterium]